MQNKVVLKDKLVLSMRKCMVSMVTRYMIFKNGETLQNTCIYGVTYHRAQNLVLN